MGLVQAQLRNAVQGTLQQRTCWPGMLACKAFIAASQDCQNDACKLLINEQLECNKKRWANSNAAAREIMSKSTVNNACFPDSLYRLKDRVFPRVIKFLGIEETTKGHRIRCRALLPEVQCSFEKRLPQFGNPDCFKSTKEWKR